MCACVRACVRACACVCVWGRDAAELLSRKEGEAPTPSSG